MNRNALERLARDIAEDLRCDCYTEDLETGVCPCGGDGRDSDGDPTWEGCWNCQALAALAEPESEAFIDAAAPRTQPKPQPARGAAARPVRETGARRRQDRKRR